MLGLRKKKNRPGQLEGLNLTERDEIRLIQLMIHFVHGCMNMIEVNKLLPKSKVLLTEWQVHEQSRPSGLDYINATCPRRPQDAG